MKRTLLPLLIASLVVLPACNRGASDGAGDSSSSGSSATASEEIRETRNVTYRGTVEELGATIYMQGSHKLVLGDGRMLILESAAVDLDVYLNQEVEVFGALRPTVEAGGIIMRVERITDLSGSAFSETNSTSRSSASSPTTSTAASSQSSIAPAASSIPTSSPTPSSVRSSAAASAGSSTDVTLEARIQLMAKQDFSDRNWTQQYCTSHIGFCVPVHKNWWYVSFGNTVETLWHVEVNSEEFEGLGKGPIHIDVIGGSVESAGAADGSVVVNGGTVKGYRSWTQGRHIAITADARLETAVRYMTEHLREQQ